jgi:hypothetical protein
MNLCVLLDSIWGSQESGMGTRFAGIGNERAVSATQA